MSLKTTMIILINDDELLLANKKRGFGMGRWMGVGGKLDPGESLEQAAIRECQEEIQVTPKNIWNVATLDYRVIYNDEHENLSIHVYFCDSWDGKPQETEEMAPKWFKQTEIPYDKMWPDTKHWLPLLLKGKKLTGKFEYDESHNLLLKEIKEVEKL